MANHKITYENKVGIIPKKIHKHQAWDDDFNEIKAKHNSLDDDVVKTINGNEPDPTGNIVIDAGSVVTALVNPDSSISLEVDGSEITKISKIGNTGDLSDSIGTIANDLNVALNGKNIVFIDGSNAMALGSGVFALDFDDLQIFGPNGSLKLQATNTFNGVLESANDEISNYTDRTFPDWGNVKGRFFSDSESLTTVDSIVFLPSGDLELKYTGEDGTQTTITAPFSVSYSNVSGTPDLTVYLNKNTGGTILGEVKFNDGTTDNVVIKETGEITGKSLEITDLQQATVGESVKQLVLGANNEIKEVGNSTVSLQVYTPILRMYTAGSTLWTDFTATAYGVYRDTPGITYWRARFTSVNTTVAVPSDLVIEVDNSGIPNSSAPFAAGFGGCVSNHIMYDSSNSWTSENINPVVNGATKLIRFQDRTTAGQFWIISDCTNAHIEVKGYYLTAV